MCEFQIDETFRVPELGTIVGGLLVKGVIREGTELMMGNRLTETVEALKVDLRLSVLSKKTLPDFRSFG